MTRGLLLPLFGGAALAAATPPAVFPGAEFLVFVGLAVWFAIAADPPRPKWHTYLLGCVHMAWFSWSVHHVMWPAYGAIVVLGGVYFVLGTIALRTVAPRWQAVAFGLVTAASFWLRANVPAIHYPHGQPCHGLWGWPALLGSVTLGGEALANALLGWLAASLGELWAGWRLGEPAWPRALRRATLTFAIAVIATVAGSGVHFMVRAAGSSPSIDGTPLAHVVLVEPGLHSFDYLRGLPRTFEERLREPTQQVLRETPAGPQPGVGQPGRTPPRSTLVLWPESSIPLTIDVDDITAGAARLLAGQLTPRSSDHPQHLLLGVNVRRAGRETPAAVLVDLAADGRILGHYEKQCLVPGGEFLPLLFLLPQAVVDWMRGVFEQALGSMPDLEPGRPLPLLQTADGTPFGTLLCYDNAFPGPAADQVAAGARFLCVLSNETWYRGGGELTQLVAMTTIRALETATPLIRCTTDGWSLVVGADGRIAEQLPLRSSPDEGPRILRATVSPGPGRLPPMAWLRAATGPFAAFLLGLALLHAVAGWARLRVARTAPKASGGAGEPVPPAASGS